MATTKDVKIVINPPNFQQVKLKVTGLTPLIQNKMKETIIQQMEDVRAGKAKKSTRTAVDPKKEYIKSAYKQYDGTFGFQSSAFKQCAVRSGKGLGLPSTNIDFLSSLSTNISTSLGLTTRILMSRFSNSSTSL